ncbi:MAG TPA: LytTR family DNA-binding domain-containing protein [Acidobacteriota bacterium]|nr:LytTR family DNA-binding domain-containing protein [Acidobacteriota bacterium]
MTIRAVTVDDEPLARRRLRRLLAEHSDVELVGVAASGSEAIKVVLEERPDVVFLDVRMPDKDGLETLRALHEHLPETVRPLAVFTTAYEEHAVEAFALEGTDYLVKPIDREQLSRALRRVRQGLWQRRLPQDEPDAPPATPEDRQRISGHLAGHQAGKIVNLQLEDIACVSVEDTITWAYTPQGRYRLKQALHEIEERLPSPPFVRVSRASIINLEWIDHLAPMFSGTYTAVLRPAVGTQVHVSRRRARRLRELLGW